MVIAMSWQEELKNKAQSYYQKIKHVCHRVGVQAGGWLGVLVMTASTNAAAGDKKDTPADDRQPSKVERVNFTNSVTSDTIHTPHIYNHEECRDIRELDINKVTAAVSRLTLADIMAKGLASKEDIQTYQFAAEDFQQMKSSNLGLRLERKFAANCARKTPQGDCLTGVRKTVCAVTGQNIYTHSGAAREWWERVDECEESPFVIIGKVQVRDEGGRLQDHGNIKLNDLKALNDGIVVIDGNKKGQPAGHVSFVKARYDTQGNFIGTDSYCDGKENYVNVVDHKIGGGNRRYGSTAVVMLPNDTKPSDGLAKFIVDRVIARETNALKIGKLLAANGQSAQDFIKTDTFNIITDTLPYNDHLSAPQRVQAAEAHLARPQEADTIPHRRSTVNNDKNYTNVALARARAKGYTNG